MTRDHNPEIDRSKEATPECLTPQELEDYALTAELPFAKLDHIEGCQVCDQMIGMVKAPPDLSLLVAAMTGSRAGERRGLASRSHQNPWAPRNIMFSLALVACLGLGLSTASLWHTRGSLRADLATARNSLALAEARVADLDAILNSMTPVSNWTDAEIHRALSTNMGVTSQQLTELFCLAQLTQDKSGICRAALVGSENTSSTAGKRRFEVIAARNFLDTFTEDEIRQGIEEGAEKFGAPAREIYENILKVIKQ